MGLLSPDLRYILLLRRQKLLLWEKGNLAWLEVRINIRHGATRLLHSSWTMVNASPNSVAA